MRMQFSKSLKESHTEVTRFSGVDYTCPEAQLPLHMAADMSNLYVDSMGRIRKRTGYQKLMQTEGRVNGIFCYTYSVGAQERKQYFVHVGTGLYFCTLTQDGMTLGQRITDSLADQKSRSFHFGGALYILGAGYYKIMWDAGYGIFQIGRICRAETDTTQNSVFLTQTVATQTGFSGTKALFMNAECRYKEIEFEHRQYGFSSTEKLYVAPPSLAGKVRVESVHYLDLYGEEFELEDLHYKVQSDNRGLYVLLARNDIYFDVYKHCAPHVVLTYNNFVYTPANIINRSPTGMNGMDGALSETANYDGTILEGYNLAAPLRTVEFYSPVAERKTSALRLYLEPTALAGKVMRIYIDGVLLQKYTVFRNGHSEPKVWSYQCHYVDLESDLLPETDCVVRVEYVLSALPNSKNGHNIDACSVFGIFGGQNDTRVFLAGNKTQPAYDYASGLYDATYFPDTGYTCVGADQSAIVGYHKISGYQVILKDGMHHDATQYLRTCATKEDGTVYFTVMQGAQGVGAQSVSSFKTCRDRMLFASKDGVYEIKGTNVDAQTNIKCLSEAVGVKLKTEALSDAVCAVQDGKYLLCVDTKAYILDIEQNLQWYVYRDLPEITCIYAQDGDFLFGASDGGVYCFMDPSQANAYYDNVAADGSLSEAKAIRAYWDIPVTTLGCGYRRKSIEDLCIYLAPQDKTSLRVYYTNEFWEKAFRHSEEMGQFDFSKLDFADFDFNTSEFPICINTRAKAKRVRVFGARLENAQPGEGLVLTGFALKYRVNNAIK